MAVSQKMTCASFGIATNATTARTLDKSTNQYKAVGLTTAGLAALSFTTNVTLNYIGVLQEGGSTSQAANVCVGGITQFRMSASTLSAGDVVGASSLGLGIAPTSDNAPIGRILYGSSGGAGRLVTVNLDAGYSTI
jgi:hypothetical protein